MAPAAATSTAALLWAIFFSLTAYTLSASAQTYWQLAPISLYGQLLFFLSAVSAFALLLLLALALYARDPTILLPHSDPQQRRLFCFTLCPCACPRARARARAPAAPLPPFSLPLRWAALTQTELLLLLGLNNASASLLQWYANPPARQPPLISALVPTLQAFFAVPLARHALGDARPFLRGGGWLPCASALCVCLGVAVSVAPSAAAPPSAPAQEPGADVLAWTLLNALSQVPSAMALVGAQAYLLRAGAMRRGAPPLRRAIALARFVLYNQVGVGLAVGACAWLDLLPWFGSSTPSTWWSGLRFSFACSLGLAGSDAACPPSTPLYAALTVLPYALYLGGIALVAGSSAVFGNVLETAQSALQALVWLVPGVNPAPQDTPLWSALGSFALMVGGVGLLRAWEAGQSEPAVTAEGLEPVGEGAEWAGEEGGEGGEGGGRGGGEDSSALLLQ
jgi:hypothetical protein